MKLLKKIFAKIVNVLFGAFLGLSVASLLNIVCYVGIMFTGVIFNLDNNLDENKKLMNDIFNLIGIAGCMIGAIKGFYHRD